MRVILLFIAGAVSLLAHHSAAAEYEAKVIRLEGKLTRVYWTNPHVWFYLDVRDASGKVTNWDLEGSSPNGLIRNGWQKGTVKAGDEVTVECSKAKDRENGCKVRTMTVPDGRRLPMGSSEN
jgi:hypothetical protein